MKSRTENGAGSDGASPLIVVRLLDRLPLLYQILDLTAEISRRLGQRVLRIRLIRMEERIARQKQRPPIVNARHHFEHGSDAPAQSLPATPIVNSTAKSWRIMALP